MTMYSNIRRIILENIDFKYLKPLSKLKWFILTPFTSDKKTIQKKYKDEIEIKIIEELISSIAPSVANPPVIIDIGANIGLYSYFITKSVEKYKGTKTNIEGTRHLLMLIGLLVYLEIEPERLLRIFPRGFRLLNLSKPFLEQVLGRSTFIPGFFYLMGIDLFTKKPLYPNKWKILIPRLFNLNLKTKAVRTLVEVFQRKIKKRIIPV